MAISLDSYLSGGGAVSSFTPTGDYVSGVTTSGAVTIDITAPAGKKIVFTHFRGVEWTTIINRLNLGVRDKDTYENHHAITSLFIDGIDAKGAMIGVSDAMGSLGVSDFSFSLPFVGFKMSTFNASFTISTGYAIAYTYYIADE